ncbi:hypothetical protein KHQ06_07820 [Nocardia tengchongensis]|uniref:DUF8017 domain-containing protein n=1 Tax=Nocardia tengchongensis TaxID=2055889 RepID=A0ABX8CVE1_9NOCA|nr:hypothetical protein [Nocardia tengchongensis]QVI22869.1 hypothetical protein KHQ06_07820 [Nocardia tengchongensis]
MANSYGTGPAPFPATSPPPGNYPPPPGDRGRLWLLAGIGALVVAIVAILATVVVMRDSGSTPSPTALPASTTKPVTTAPATTTPSSTLTPRIPGYQVVVPKDLKAAWDIPKDWTIDPSTTTYGTDADHLAAAGFSEEGVDYCPNNVRTNMFLSTSDISDATAAATDVGAHAARLGWSTRTSSQAGTPQPLDAGDNTLHGTFLENHRRFHRPHRLRHHVLRLHLRRQRRPHQRFPGPGDRRRHRRGPLRNPRFRPQTLRLFPPPLTP